MYELWTILVSPDICSYLNFLMLYSTCIFELLAVSIRIKAFCESLSNLVMPVNVFVLAHCKYHAMEREKKILARFRFAQVGDSHEVVGMRKSSYFAHTIALF